MWTHPEIDPFIFGLQINGWGPRWYGFMYLLGFLAAFWLLKYRCRQRADWREEEAGDIIFYGAIGVVLGGRIGYMLFYNFSEFIQAPWILFSITSGGMSFHGGLLGVLVAYGWYAWKTQRPFMQLVDVIAPIVPPGLFFGRIGNFINGELFGRPVADPSAWYGMVFPKVDNLARHPSMLYEAVLEGLVLFTVLWLYALKPRPRLAVSGLFAIGYGIARFVVEFVRQPDAHLQFIAFGWMTMGMALSLPLIGVGLIMMAAAYGYYRPRQVFS